MAGKIDLHVHTTASDGTCTPEEVVERARAAGLTAVAITDHDTMAGVAPAIAAGDRLGVEVIPGIEISADYQDEDTHVLGYGLDPGAPALRRVLDWVREDRRQRNEKVAALMRRDGISVSLEALEAEHPGGTIGRPHFARVLVEQGRAASVSDAFARYLNPGKRYYLSRSYLPMAEAVEIIRRCGGVAVLAHPLQYGYSRAQLRALAAYAAGLGVAGMEIYYTGYGPKDRAGLLGLAEEFGLFATGGSDFHGKNKPDIALGAGRGALSVPASCLTELKRRIEEARE